MRKTLAAALAVVAAIYLLAGIPMLVMTLRAPAAPPIFRITAALLLACAGAGVAGCILALVGKLRQAKWLLLPALAIVSLVIAWPPGEWIVYPSFLTVPLTVFLRLGDGSMYRLGINALPAVLCIASAFAIRSPSQPTRDEPGSTVGSDGADTQ